jgi:hypothetical protein
MPSAPSAANEPAAESPKPVAKATAGEEGKWGTIKGRFVWGGEALPEPVFENTEKEPKCVAKDGGKIVREEWVVNPKNKGVRYVFVWLRAEDDKAKLPVHPDLAKTPEKNQKVEVDQPCCMFEPHCLALRSDQVLVAKNSSQISHNVDWGGIGQDGGNNLVPPGNKLEIKMKPSKYEIKIKCGIHPWMTGHIRVFDHPYYAVTDADGNFEIKNAPAGKWRLVVWHETGWRNQDTKAKGDPVEIKQGENNLDRLEIKPRKE